MIAEIFKQQRYELGRRRGFKLGLELGIELGRRRGFELGLEMSRRRVLEQCFAQGRQAQQKAWESWNRRRETAQANGEPFTEPPPTLESTPNGYHG